MIVLGIESSCDETAVAIVEDGHRVHSNLVSSQVRKHAEYGGVIPELAAREHLRAIAPLVELALREAKLDLSAIDGIAVTQAPGLLPALLVGISYAKGLSAALGKPLIGINHMIAHVYGAFIDQPEVRANPESYPVIALVVSGGHTMLLLIEADGRCSILGQTLDDAAGEAFDKAAKILFLPYPGGPLIDKLARTGDPRAVDFPRGLTGGGGTPLKPENRLNFSFSGLKTALLYNVRPETSGGDSTMREMGDEEFLNIIASYQEAVVDVLVRKTMWAVEDHRARSLVVCGGVACNSRLRVLMAEAAASRRLPLLIAPPAYCTDNAAMIAGLGCHELAAGRRSDYELDATPRFPVPERVYFAPCLPR